MSVSTENFLKSIYKLKFDYGKKASSSNLAETLNISHAAVTDMAKKLSVKGLIIYIKYKEISLTKKGELQALKVIRRHRLWESFLFEVLKLSPNEIHREAEILEHQTSDYLLSKIDEYLGHPRFDPHGDPIPDPGGNLPVAGTITLSNGIKGEKYIINRIQYNERYFQNFFIKNSIRIGSEIYINDVFKEDQSVSIEINNKQIVFNSKFASCIHIKSKTI